MVTTDLFLDQKRFISVRRASQETGYTKDYLGQLCRHKKIPAKLVGRTWFVDLEALLAYKKSVSIKEDGLIEKKIDNKEHLVLPSASYVSESPVELPKLNKFRSQGEVINIPKEKAFLIVSFVVVLFVVGNVFVSATNLLVPELSKSLGDRFYLALTHSIEPVAQNNPDQGVIVFPDSVDTQEKIEEIENSFSDEVEVFFDDGESSGVIRPIFRSGNGDDYAFVMVPVKQKK